MERKTRESAVPGTVEQSLYEQCAYVGSVRCRYPGTLSTHTDGSGPWWCRWHLSCTDGIYGEAVVQASLDFKVEPGEGRRHPLVEMTAAQRRALPRESIYTGPIDHLAWARRIVQRAQEGEAIAAHPLQLAKDALGLREIRREPGQEG